MGNCRYASGIPWYATQKPSRRSSTGATPMNLRYIVKDGVKNARPLS